MTKYRCMIIDDEELARDLIENFIERISYLQLKGKFSNPLKALSDLRDGAIDIIFLDIQMPEMTGIEFLKTLSNTPAVIFTTAYDRYALEGYELSVIDYLLKPFSFARFLKAVNKATDLIELKREGKESKRSITSSDKPHLLEFLTVKADHKIFRLHLKDIVYIQSNKEYVVYHTNQKKIMSLGSLRSLEDKLPSDFLRIHKSYIVSKKHVKNLEGNQLNLGDINLPIGGSYRDLVIKELFQNVN